jgi:adenine deaminase
VAFKFVSLNPAKQLRIDQYVGSLEVGKEADFVLWSHAPVDYRTVCLQTWIDGRKYYDRALETGRYAKLQHEYDALVAKAKKIVKLDGGGDDASSDGGASFFNVSLEHQYDNVNRDCMDGTGASE